MKFIVLDQTGHTEVLYDDKVEAEAQFKRLVGLGFTPATLRPDGQHTVAPPSERKFDPTAEQTMFIPQLKGG